MALSILRLSNPKRTQTAHLNTLHFENKTSSIQFHPPTPSTPYFTTHTIPNKCSFINPPTHLHLYQTEDFIVIKGTGIWYLPTRNQKTTMKAGDPPIHLPAGVFHRFENPSDDDEELVVQLRIDPDNEKVNLRTEERFFRNFFGYLEDCRVQGLSPSIFQLELFLWTVDGPLAIPVPGPDSVKWYASWFMCLVLGVWIGKYILGYKETYPEYYKESAD